MKIIAVVLTLATITACTVRTDQYGRQYACQIMEQPKAFIPVNRPLESVLK